MSLMCRHSKSASNVIETPKDIRNSIERRYKTCSSDNLSTNRQSEVNTTLNIQKSQKFFTKLVASLEKKNNKNGDLNADDEFLTKCYTRPLLPKINSYYTNCNTTSTNCNYNQTKCQRRSSLEKIPIVNTSTKLFESPAIRFIDGVEKNLTDITKETSDAVNEGKINRKRSIKGMLSSIMGWKKHTGKEKPGRFWSRDELEVGGNFSPLTIPIIPRARSLQTFLSNNTNGKDKNIVESLDRTATIRPFYGNRRNLTTPTKYLESCQPRTIPFKEDSGYGSGFFTVDETDDNLVKPSAVREITRRLSCHPEQSWNKHNNIIGSSQKVFNNYKKEKSSYRSKSFAEEISHIRSYKSLDLASDNICTLPVTRKLKDEYLSVLANNKRLAVSTE